ncbi:MAG: hypothetical protein JEZ07_09375 [Phycisphaerae bacterium]|nr:hypothetical protein [Phycisphaerae bacterium]
MKLHYNILIVLLMVALVSLPIGLATANDCYCAGNCECHSDSSDCCGGCDDTSHKHKQNSNDDCKCHFSHITNSSMTTIDNAHSIGNTDIAAYLTYLPDNRKAAAFLFDTPRPPAC